ncbi:hypothetical protein SUGI_0045350 [Cryptomeria japonica]|nr:hypothetical protein SUGI_0045350 [Cryptomeria japonica]
MQDDTREQTLPIPSEHGNTVDSGLEDVQEPISELNLHKLKENVGLLFDSLSMEFILSMQDDTRDQTLPIPSGDSNTVGSGLEDVQEAVTELHYESYY